MDNKISEDLIFENAWNAIARGNEIWNRTNDMGKISFSVTQKYFFNKRQSYYFELEPAPHDGFSQNIFCTVIGTDTYTKQKFSIKRKLSTLAFYSDLRANKHFDTASLYVNRILSLPQKT